MALTGSRWDRHPVSTSEPEPGTRRTVQEYGDATFGQADPPPLSEVPARVEEWDGERWVVPGEASSTEEMKRLLALPRAE